MNMKKSRPEFKLGMFVFLMLPYLALNFFVERRDMEVIVVTALVITVACMVLYICRNRQAIVEGIVASLLLFALLSACAFIPVIGWIFDVLVLLYALSSALSALQVLMPLVVRVALMWAVFVATLLPTIHHPVFSPLAYGVFCLFVTSALSKKADPYGELLILITSVPLLMIIIASLGRMFRSTVGTARVGVSQNVSGYTTQTGVQVNAYTRTVAKGVTTVTTSVNTNAVIANTAAANSVKADDTESSDK